ncbi:hypothetical protein LZ30DRAFT_774960 [Colletotrichum cereale]|nr:hypothetical protein LZ30DRAFT_774960 [Colletotrichum cereale]
MILRRCPSALGWAGLGWGKRRWLGFHCQCQVEAHVEVDHIPERKDRAIKQPVAYTEAKKTAMSLRASVHCPAERRAAGGHKLVCRISDFSPTTSQALISTGQ